MSVNCKVHFPSANLCTLALAILLTTSATATKWECGERSNLSLEGKNYCAAGDFRLAETNLQRILDALIDKHKSAFGDARALIDSQSAFKSYRDNQCAAETKRIKDKPFHPMIVAQCKSRLTNLRINEVKRMQQELKDSGL